MAYAGTFPHTNTGTTSGIYVAVTSFSGNVGNTGVIAIGGLPGGIVIIGSSINGAVSNGGTISTILPRKSGIGIVNSTVTGSVSNSGSISVDLTAIGISNAIISGGISNSGTITSQQLAAGIRLSGLTTFGGGISNGRGGTISAGTAVAVDSVAGFVGDISNAGLLTGRTGIGIANSSINGAIVDSGTIDASAHGILIDSASTIASASTAVSITGPTLTGGVSNAGTISASNAGIGIDDVTSFAGNISNSGTITADTGISIGASTIAGAIADSGSIDASSHGILIDGTSKITASYNGVMVGGTASGTALLTTSSFVGGIGNSGAITAANDGILVGGRVVGGPSLVATVAVQTFSGGISNSGTIAATSNGIVIGGTASRGQVTVASFSSGIRNFATIMAGSNGVWVGGNATVGSGGHSASVAIATFGDGITNSGTVTAGSNGIWIGGNATAAAGFSYTASVTISKFSGGISNSGTISADNVGILIGGNATAGGGTRNTASVTISTFAGGISNLGTIQAVGSAIDVSDVASFTGGIANDAGGVINSTNDQGIVVSNVANFSDGIANAGVISVLGAGVFVNSVTSFSGGITNAAGGTISVGGAGIFAFGVTGFSGGISNAGTITAPDGILVADVASFSGGVSNSGSISAANGGIVVGSVAGFFAGNISNSGTITAQTGIVIGSGGVSFAAGGAIVNSGTISGSLAAIDTNLASAPVTIDQVGGLISGDILLSANADVLNISGGSIAGNIVGAGSSDTVDFVLGPDGSFTYAGTVSGVPTVDVSSGTLVLSGTIDPTPPGTLTIATGATVLVGSGGNIVDTVADDGVFAFEQVGVYTYAGAVLGNGVVEQLGAGTTVLAGNDAVNGGTDVEAGTLALGSGGSIAGNVTFDGANATLQFDSGISQLGGDIAGAVSGDAIDLGFESFAAGDHAVWSQNGSTGTLTIETASNAALATMTLAGEYASADFDVTADNQNDVLINLVTPHIIDDYNGDAISDVLWRDSSGTLAEWLMSGSAITSSASPTYQGSVTSPDASWRVVGTGDFNGDGNADILWQSTDGSVADWTMNGSTITASDYLRDQGQVVAPDSSWSIASTGDFNGDGDADILWRQSTTGSLAEWLMNGSTITSSASPTYQGSVISPDASWRVVGTGDFNGDGNADILWQSTDGSLADWTMNGSTIAASDYLRDDGQVVAPDSSWGVAGIGDFNGDGNADILWRQSTTGSLAIWLMNGSTIESSASVTSGGGPAIPDSTWNVVEIGDFNGGADAGILWHQSTTGALVEWQMNGSQIVSSQTVTSGGNPVAPPSSWQVQAKPTDFV